MSISVSEIVIKLAHRDDPRTEATVQADIRQLLLTLELNLHDDELQDIVLEAQVGDRRRIDIEVGATVIEVKKDLRRGNVRREAVSQLEGYVAAREQSMGQRYVGVVTDGAEWRCYHLDHGKLVEVSTHLVADRPDVDALAYWLEGVLATTRDVKPLGDVVRCRLGVGEQRLPARSGDSPGPLRRASGPARHPNETPSVGSSSQNRLGHAVPGRR